MAEEMTPKIDDALDTGSNTKNKNLSVQDTSIRLNKDNYLSWSADLEIGITSRGRLSYITGEKPAPSKTDPRWATWALKDSQAYAMNLSPLGAKFSIVTRSPGLRRCMPGWNLRNNIAKLCILTPAMGVPPQRLLIVPLGLDSVLFDVVVIVTSWGILWIFVGIFILRRDLFVVALLLVGGVLLCLTLVRVVHKLLKNQNFPPIKSRNYKLISVGYLLRKRKLPRLKELN
ncbi:hypothetical protein EJ110_NYTH29886 [Nymphaea thermarum]|nr:hypothetical protein EJ110_NYTH29886 [Nymphaea thermarum]